VCTNKSAKKNRFIALTIVAQGQNCSKPTLNLPALPTRFWAAQDRQFVDHIQITVAETVWG
jgi:hypothetical protein